MKINRSSRTNIADIKRHIFRTSISLGFLGWMSYVVTLILQQHTNIVRPRLRIDVLSRPFWRSEKGIRLMFTCLGALVTALLYGLYCLFTGYQYVKVFQFFLEAHHMCFTFLRTKILYVAKSFLKTFSPILEVMKNNECINS